MSTGVIPQRVTALSILDTDGVGIGELLEHDDTLFSARKAVPVVGDALWRATLREVGHAAAGLLGVDLGDVMVTGWSKYEELREAGRRSLEIGSSAVVDLAGRDLELRQHPHVDIAWHDQTVASIPLELLVTVHVHAVEAVVRGGSLVQLTTGRWVVAASIDVGGEKIGPKERELDPHLVIVLGTGIPWVADP
jgi:hypothetical protein